MKLIIIMPKVRMISNPTKKWICTPRTLYFKKHFPINKVNINSFSSRKLLPLFDYNILRKKLNSIVLNICISGVFIQISQKKVHSTFNEYLSWATAPTACSQGHLEQCISTRSHKRHQKELNTSISTPPPHLPFPLQPFISPNKLPPLFINLSTPLPPHDLPYLLEK